MGFRTPARSLCICSALSLLFAIVIPGSTATLSAQKRTPPGPIRLEVDATSVPQKLLHTHLQIPVQPGPLTLYYPEWIPGEHAPSGPIDNVAGLKFTGAGNPIPWRRDLTDMCTFHLTIPSGVNLLDVKFDFLLTSSQSGFSAGASATPFLDLLSWNQLVLYPSGYSAMDLTFVPSLRLPPGWKYGTALPGAKQNGDAIDFAPVSLDTLVDSPVLAGEYFRSIQLTPGENPPHEMDLAADSADALAMPPEMQMEYHQLVEETGALFGVRHYRDYHFLVTLSDDVAHFGLEHHESSDDRTGLGSLTSEPGRIAFAELIPHEFTHSWNGKFRRPADLLSPDYHQPMQDDLLWVYEGLTEYLGVVLTARSGLENEQQSHEELARLAAVFDLRPGREWRPLQDTAGTPPLASTAPAVAGRTGGVERIFTKEAELLWLDVDATLRRLTNDKKSMNDFCRAFYAGPGGQPDLKPYTFDDVVATLNSLAPFDWNNFLPHPARFCFSSRSDGSLNTENSGWKSDLQ